jgi:Family of unknown function (DUF6114)
MGRGPDHSDVEPFERQVDRWTGRGAAILVAIAAFFVLLGGIVQGLLTLVIFALAGLPGHGFVLLGLLVGFLMFVMAALLWFVPRLRVAWGAVTIVLALLSLPFDALGGFILGFILALIGAVVAIVARGGTSRARIVVP